MFLIIFVSALVLVSSSPITEYKNGDPAYPQSLHKLVTSGVNSRGESYEWPEDYLEKARIFEEGLAQLRTKYPEAAAQELAGPRRRLGGVAPGYDDLAFTSGDNAMRYVGAIFDDGAGDHEVDVNRGQGFNFCKGLSQWAYGNHANDNYNTNTWGTVQRPENKIKLARMDRDETTSTSENQQAADMSTICGNLHADMNGCWIGLKYDHDDGGFNWVGGDLLASGHVHKWSGASAGPHLATAITSGQHCVAIMTSENIKWQNTACWGSVIQYGTMNAVVCANPFYLPA